MDRWNKKIHTVDICYKVKAAIASLLSAAGLTLSEEVVVVCTPPNSTISCAHEECTNYVPGECFTTTERYQGLVPDTCRHVTGRTTPSYSGMPRFFGTNGSIAAFRPLPAPSPRVPLRENTWPLTLRWALIIGISLSIRSRKYWPSIPVIPMHLPSRSCTAPRVHCPVYLARMPSPFSMECSRMYPVRHASSMNPLPI